VLIIEFTKDFTILGSCPAHGFELKDTTVPKLTTLCTDAIQAHTLGQYSKYFFSSVWLIEDMTEIIIPLIIDRSVRSTTINMDSNPLIE
jgi:hypothetical protein